MLSSEYILKESEYIKLTNPSEETEMKKRIASFICALVIFSLLIPATVLSASESVIAGSYGDGLVKFSKNKKYGYMDIFGNIVIKASFMSASPFHNGMAHVQVSDGKYAKDEYINRAGKVVFTAPKRTKTRYYGLCDTWEEDYVTAEIWSINQKSGTITPVGYNYVNEKGKLFNDEEYQFAGSFQEGYALVGKGSSSKKSTRSGISGKNEHWLAVFQGNSSVRVATEYYYIDKQGQRLGNLTWSMGRDFKNGLAAVAIKAGNSLHWGFINSDGVLQITPEYASVGDLENGMIWVSDGENYGYISENGDVKIPLTWKSAGDFNEDGFAVVKDDYHAKIIDKKGNIILDSDYSNLYPIAGTDRYRADDGFARGLIDRTGTVLVPLAYQYTNSAEGVFSGTRYDNILVICNEFGDIITPVIKNGELLSADDPDACPDGTPCTKLPLAVGDSDSLNLCTFVDENMNTLSINIVDNMRGESFTISRSNGKTVLFDLDGNRLGNSEWNGFSSTASNEYVICVKKADFYGFIDAGTGETLVTPQFTDITLSEDGIFVAMMGDNVSYLDSHARTVLPEITKKSAKDDIKALQQLLTDQGYYTGKINGSFSKQLTEAITAAQEAFGLDPTGLADSDFQYALQNAQP